MVYGLHGKCPGRFSIPVQALTGLSIQQDQCWSLSVEDGRASTRQATSFRVDRLTTSCGDGSSSSDQSPPPAAPVSIYVPATLWGSVVDIQGEPVIGAQVRATGPLFVPAVARNHETFTTRAGEFHLELVEGAYNLYVSAEG